MATPSISSVIQELRENNATKPEKEKANIIVVQEPSQPKDTTNQEILRVLNTIYSVLSEQLKMHKIEVTKSEMEKPRDPMDFQKEAIEIASTQQQSGGGGGNQGGSGEGSSASSEGGGGGKGFFGTAWDTAKKVGGAVVDFAKQHPIATTIGAGAAIGGGFHIADKIKTSKDKDKLMLQTYDAFRNAGFSDNQARALIAEVGRENSFRRADPKLGGVFGYHQDPKNDKLNVGLFSWQGSRGREIQKILQEKGLIKDGKIVQSQDSLNEMAKFARKEMQTTHSRFGGKAFLENPNISSEEAAKLMGGKGGYIAWDMYNPKYRGPGLRNRATYYNKIDELLENKKIEPDKNTATKLSENGEEPQRIKSVIKQQQKGAKYRTSPITDTLDQKLSEAIQAVYGEGYTGSVYSGGQGEKHKGTHRHDEGHAADLRVYDSKGKLISGNKLAPLAQYWRAMGYGGIGLEMGKGGIHLDERKEDYLKKHGGGYHWSYGNRTKEQLEAIRRGEKGILPEMANPQLAGYTQKSSDPKKQETTTAETTKNGRHEIVQTDDKKSSIAKAGILAPLEQPFEKMIGFLSQIAENTENIDGEKKEEEKASKEEEEKPKEETASKEESEPEQKEESYSKVDSEQETKLSEEKAQQLGMSGGYKADDFWSQEKSDDLKKSGVKTNKENELSKHIGPIEGKENGLQNYIENSSRDFFKPDRDNSSLVPSQFGVVGFGEGQQRPQERSPGFFEGMTNNPFGTMSGVLGAAGRAVSMGAGVQQSMRTGGAYGTGNAIGMIGGMMGGMGGPLGGLGRMMGGVGSAVQSIGMMGNMAKQGGMGGVYGGINAAQNVLGSLGGMFGGGKGGMGGSFGDFGVNPFGGGAYNRNAGLPSYGNVMGGGFGNFGGMFGGGSYNRNAGIPSYDGVMGGGQGILGGIGNVLGGVGGMMGSASRIGGGGMNDVLGGINVAQGAMGAAGGLFGAMKGIGSSIGGLFGSEIGGGSKSISSMGIGDDSKAVNEKYSQMGSNLTGLQSENDGLSSMLSSSSSSSGGQQSGSTQGSTQTQGRSAGTGGGGGGGGSGFKSGDKRAGTSSGAMGAGISMRNEETCLKMIQLGCFLRGTV